MEPKNPPPGPKDKTNIPNPAAPFNWEMIRGLTAEHRGVFAQELQAQELARLNYNIESFMELAKAALHQLGIAIPQSVEQPYQQVLPAQPPAVQQPQRPQRQAAPPQEEPAAVYQPPDLAGFKAALAKAGVTNPQALIPVPTIIPGR